MIFAFDDYELDTQLHELRHRSDVVNVEPKVFALLCLLVEHRAKAVSRDEIVEAVWDGRIVSEATISSAIKFARRVIGDTGAAQRRIKTLRGFGFRFVGEVDMRMPASVVPAPDLDVIATEPPKSKQPSIVALPFDLLGEGLELPTLSRAIVHDVIQALSRLRWLRVIARATAFQLSGHPLSELAARLDVNYCLTGTIEVEHEHVVITVELVDLIRDRLIWIDRLEGRLDDVHDLRAQIVRGTVASIETRISQHEARFAAATPTENLDAWTAFHVGLSNMYRFTQAGNDRAIGLFDQAITLDPSFAKAYAARSFVHFQNAFNVYPGVDKAVEIKRALEAAERSLELDELDHFANFVRGRASWLTGDLEQGLEWVLRSTSINPNFAQGYYTGGLLGVLSDGSVDFESASDRAMLLSPLDPMLYGFHGIRALGYLTDKNYADAARWADRSANAPWALAVMDLVAVIANDLAGETDAAKKWAHRAKSRHDGIDSNYLFTALPFRDQEFRGTATRVLARYGM